MEEQYKEVKMAKFNEIREFLGGSSEVEIAEGKTLTIYPLKVGDMAKMYPSNFENLPNEEKTKLGYELILKSLNDENVTMKDIEELTTSTFQKLMDGINKLNGFDDENDRAGTIKNKIARIEEAKKTKNI